MEKKLFNNHDAAMRSITEPLFCHILFSLRPQTEVGQARPISYPFVPKLLDCDHSRDASDEISTNSDENSAYGIPSSSSGISDKGYGTKNKSTDDSIKGNSLHKNRGELVLQSIITL